MLSVIVEIDLVFPPKPNENEMPLTSNSYW